MARGTRRLDEADVLRATVETVAENTPDGVISPMLYAFLGGSVPWCFQAAGTPDAMVGCLNETYRDNGWTSAKLDNALDLPPARPTAWLTGLDGRNAASIVLRDHAIRLSLNCA